MSPHPTISAPGLVSMVAHKVTVIDWSVINNISPIASCFPSDITARFGLGGIGRVHVERDESEIWIGSSNDRGFLDRYLSPDTLIELMSMLNDGDERVRCSPCTLSRATGVREVCKPEEREVLSKAMELV